ncbi:MAG: RICIN domain-containing protein [Spirochaetales bacterium]|nr:RICIN domain-containing protein [Spirochaetales bacterium]
MKKSRIIFLAAALILLAGILGCNLDMNTGSDAIAVQPAVSNDAGQAGKVAPTNMKTEMYHEYSGLNLSVSYPYKAGNYIIGWDRDGKKPGPDANYLFELESAGKGYYYIKHVKSGMYMNGTTGYLYIGPLKSTDKDMYKFSFKLVDSVFGSWCYEIKNKKSGDYVCLTGRANGSIFLLAEYEKKYSKYYRVWLDLAL